MQFFDKINIKYKLIYAMLIPILIHTKYDFPLIFNKLGTPHYNNESIRVSHPSGDDQSELYS
ncbi:hypothetical protein LAA29_180160 [Leuconostoc carnosum]|nr:hypothetical protein LCAC16_270158 [Leuconostoc carnosum]SPO33957.1 hypothetical protein LAA29_180160 [Leuconostoc carnosum]